MPKVNLPMRVEPGLYHRLNRQAGGQSLSAHVESLLGAAADDRRSCITRTDHRDARSHAGQHLAIRSNQAHATRASDAIITRSDLFIWHKSAIDEAWEGAMAPAAKSLADAQREAMG